LLEITRKRGPFVIKEIWFSQSPFVPTGCDSVTFMNCQRSVSLAGFERAEYPTAVIDLAEPLDAIWKNVSSSCRYEIRRAEREGVKVRTSEDWNELYSTHRSFGQAKGLHGYSEWGRKAFIDYARNGTLFTAEFDGHILNGHLYFRDEQYMRLIIAPSRRFERGEFSTKLVGHANRLTFWTAIKHAKTSGLRVFDVGGIWTGIDQLNPRYKGINQFKMEFGGKMNTVYIYRMDMSNTFKIAQGCKDLLDRVSLTVLHRNI